LIQLDIVEITTVAILLKINNQNFRILFVRRAKNLADPWSGQIDFPQRKT
jgi:hypothetical protein